MHRDLAELAAEGLIERVHGGARGRRRRSRATRHRDRLGQARAPGEPAKALIAARAARLVDDNATIYIDASSTCLALAQRARGRYPPGPLTVVTNSPAIAFELSADLRST